MADGIESNKSTAEFDEFVAAGEVEVGDADTSEEGGDEEEGKDKKPAAKRGPKPAKTAAKPDADEGEKGEEGDEGDEGEEGDEEEGEEEGAKPKKSAKDHQIERLKREKRDLARQLREGGANAELSRRLENVEKGLPAGKTGDSQEAGKPAPDPSDTDKYPLGHLDDRYIEDKLAWLAKQEATKLADSALQREQENQRNEATTAAQEALLDQVDELSTKGSEQFEDFQELVVDAGMRGDYPLQQATFEAACEADNGPQILYDLSQDPKEARRVAKLSSYQQMKFVQERDAEIGKGKKGRTKPQAGKPPENQPRGASSKTKINPGTDNLNDFEKAWEQDAKASK